MPSLQPILDHSGPFLMVLFRLSGLFVFAPMVSSSILPGKVRVILAVMFAAALYPTLPPAQMAPVGTDVFMLVPAIAGEVAIGAAMGLLASLPMFAAQLGGLIVGQQAGITLGQVFNPALDIEADVFGQLLQFVALFAFVAMGGLDVLFIALAGTFERVPIAGAESIGLARGTVDLLVGVIASGFEIALRISAPVLCIILIETIAMSVLMKTIPQINIQTLGFATKVIAAFVAMIAAAGAIHAVIEEDTGRTLATVVEWARTLGADGPTPEGGR